MKIRNFTIAPSPSSSKPILEWTGLNRTRWINRPHQEWHTGSGDDTWRMGWSLNKPGAQISTHFGIHQFDMAILRDSCLFKATFLGSIYPRCGWWSNFMMVDWWQVRTPNFPPGLFNLGAQLSQVETSLFVTHPGPRKVKNLRSLPSAFHGQPGELPLRHVAIFR